MSDSTTPHHTSTPSTAHLVPAPGEHLTTGWEPGVASGDSIVRNYLETLVERLATTARLTGARFVRHPGVALVDLRSPYVFDDVAVCLGPWPPSEMEEIAAAASAFFGDGRDFTLLSLSPSVDLRPAGFRLLGHPPLMWRPPGGAGPRIPEELEIVPVDDGRTLADFERTLVAAYPLPDGGTIVDPRVLRGPVSGRIGYVDGEPVATGGSFSAHGLTEIEWVSTTVERRGRGYGAALAWSALAARPELPTVLLATDDGQPVYRRLGFTPIVRLTMWLRPADPTTPGG
jgi:GNAT superfamily N-acetyltransferase